MRKTKRYLSDVETFNVWDAYKNNGLTIDELAYTYTTSRANIQRIITIFKLVASKDISEDAFKYYGASMRIVRIAGRYFGYSSFVSRVLDILENNKQVTKSEPNKKSITLTAKGNTSTEFHNESILAGELVKNIVEMVLKMNERLSKLEEKAETLIDTDTNIHKELSELIHMWK